MSEWYCPNCGPNSKYFIGRIFGGRICSNCKADLPNDNTPPPYVTALIDRIAELEQRWIPCSVRLPDDMQEVLISDGKVVGHARKCTSGWEIVASNDFIGNLGVTHWHHLPPPPIEVPE